LGFNHQISPTNNIYVRKAIAAAINKKMLIDFVFKGKNEVANTVIRPPMFGAATPTDHLGIAFDPDQARQWLSMAGYPEGKDFPTLTLLHNISETHSDVAQAIKIMLKHYLNIDIKIREVPFTAYLDTLGAIPDDVHLQRLGWCADYPDGNSFLYDAFHPSGMQHMLNWNHQEYELITIIAQSLTNREKRKELYHRAEQILNQEQAAILPIYFSTGTYLVKPRVKNWYAMGVGGQHIRNFKIEQ
jgi:oligopeptide transport system substrate-binding protein